MQIKLTTDQPIKTTDDIIDAMMSSIEHAKITRGCSRDGETYYTTLTVDEQKPLVSPPLDGPKKKALDKDS